GRVNRFLRSSRPAPAASGVMPLSALLGSGQMVSAKLPKIQIAKFDGSLTDWPRFWDQFEASIDSNKFVAAVDKYSYLRSLLSPAVLPTIGGYQLPLQTMQLLWTC